MLKPRLLLLLAVGVGVGVSSGHARPAATNAWQSIIFSSPDNTGISSNVMSGPSQSSSSDLQNKLNQLQDTAPVAGFNNPPLPAAPVPMPGQIRVFQKSRNDNQDWEFMTPAEILGIAPSQILQSQEQKRNGDQVRPTTLERLLGEPNPETAYQASSVTAPSSSSTDSNDGQTNDSMFNLFGSDLGDNGNLSWSKLFGPAPAAPVQNQEQSRRAMRQFMKLFKGSPSDTAAAAAPAQTASSGAQTVLPGSTALSDLGSTEPLFNPIGASFAPLRSGIGKPTGVAPLPTITRQPAAQSIRPAWLPQPPPWLSATPQPFAVPRDHF